MIERSTRIYSMFEILKMCEEGFSEEFNSYYKRAPESIRKFIISLVENTNNIENVSKCEGVASSEDAVLISLEGYRECISEHVIDTREKDFVLDVYEKSEMILTTNIANTLVNLENVQVILKEKAVSIEEGQNINELDKKNILEGRSPYANQEFGLRMDVDELWFSLDEGISCSIHQKPYHQIQVMVRLSKTKKYGVYFYACPECKKLFMNRKKYNFYKNIFKNKRIRYHLEEK